MLPETLPVLRLTVASGEVGGASQRATKNNHNEGVLAMELRAKWARSQVWSWCPASSPAPLPNVHPAFKELHFPRGKATLLENALLLKDRTRRPIKLLGVSASLWKSMDYDCESSLCHQLPNFSWIFAAFSPCSSTPMVWHSGSQHHWSFDSNVLMKYISVVT